MPWSEEDLVPHSTPEQPAWPLPCRGVSRGPPASSSNTRVLSVAVPAGGSPDVGKGGTHSPRGRRPVAWEGSCRWGAGR